MWPAYALNINDANAADSNTFSGIISGTGSLNKSGGSTQTLSGNNTFTGPVLVTGGTLNLTGTNQFSFANVSGGTLSLGTTGNLSTGANVTVYNGGTFAFTSQNTQATAIGTVNLSGGTLLSSTNGATLYLNQIRLGAAGAFVNDTTNTGTSNIDLTGPGAGITVTANSSSTVANIATFSSSLVSSVSMNISTGVTLNNARGLVGINGFVILGGGTLNEDASPQNYIGASVTITQGTFRVTDASSANLVGHRVGNLPDNLTGRTFTINGGTFSYGGTTATAITPINITAGGGNINIESATATLTDTGGILSSGGLVKTGPGELIVPAFSATNLTINNGTLGLSSSGGVLKLSTLTDSAFTAADVMLQALANEAHS